MGHICARGAFCTFIGVPTVRADAHRRSGRGLRVGDPADEDTQIGPIINSSQLESIQDRIARAREDGA
jgi:acyl-CoA reductase-like NAD-dependent aldehyde dehydrogenase